MKNLEEKVLNKKKFLINLFLMIVLIILVCFACFFFGKIVSNEENNETENVVLRDITYQDAISPVGFGDAEGILVNFVEAYNNSDGEGLVQLMNLVATYIYSECENKDDFDSAYEQKLSADNEVEDIVIMQYSLQQQQESLISGLESEDVELTLIDHSEIEDTSKYLSKMTAKFRTVSELDDVDEVDTLEFILLHRDNAYYIIEYNLVDTE